MFEDKLFDTEHALNIYASSYVVMPASDIYEKEKLQQFETTLASCHIYIIGYLPQVDFVGSRQEGKYLVTGYEVAGSQCELRWEAPPELSIDHGPEGCYLSNAAGERFFPNESKMLHRLNYELNVHNYRVLYIGQSFGKDGSRNALDRLLKHETLQKIAIEGTPEKYRLSVLLLQIEQKNSVITLFNPRAKNKDHSSQRIELGLDKLFDTSEAERVSLYEASLIRYFQPKYNKEFKDSFPSTNMKILAECYDKDFSALIAEICIDELPFKMFTEAVTPAQYHIAKHDLHEETTRKVFFSPE